MQLPASVLGEVERVDKQARLVHERMIAVLESSPVRDMGRLARRPGGLPSPDMAQPELLEDEVPAVFPEDTSRPKPKHRFVAHGCLQWCTLCRCGSFEQGQWTEFCETVEGFPAAIHASHHSHMVLVGGVAFCLRCGRWEHTRVRTGLRAPCQAPGRGVRQVIAMLSRGEKPRGVPAWKAPL